jgi:hypothetical protein
MALFFVIIVTVTVVIIVLVAYPFTLVQPSMVVLVWHKITKSCVAKSLHRASVLMINFDVAYLFFFATFCLLFFFVSSFLLLFY